MSEQTGSQPARVSFTVRRPTPDSSRQSSAGPESNASSPAPSFRVPPPPRQQGSYTTAPSRLRHEQTEREEVDSSDEEDPEAAELVSGFDSMGVERVKPTAKPAGPLVIPVIKNRDWRQLARQKQAATGYIPDSARAAANTGPDGSQGGLGTRDSINSGPQLTGLIFKKHSPPPAESTPQDAEMPDADANEDTEMAPAKPLTEDELALQALLRGTDESESKPQVAAIPLEPMTEEAALKRDMTDLPEASSLEDYARVPVEQFGMAILRGMGWKPPKTGEDELWIPSERPALLGLGAKARPTPQGGSGSRSQALNWKTADRKYVPLLKKDRNGDIVSDEKDPRGSRPGSGQVSRRSSRSRSPQGRRDSSRREKDEYRDKDKGRDDRDRDYRSRDRRDRDSDREYRSDRDRDRAKDRSDRYEDDRRRKNDDRSDRRYRDRDDSRDYDRSKDSKRRDDRDYSSRR